MTAPDPARALADLLAEHARLPAGPVYDYCRCGWTGRLHAQHVAQVLITAGWTPAADVGRDPLRAMADHCVALPLAAVLAGWSDGDERGWRAEFDYLHETQQGQIDMLATSVQEQGIRLPILLGSDGRVWDGHHRLCVADLLALKTVPCEFADPSAVVVHQGEVHS